MVLLHYTVSFHTYIKFSELPLFSMEQCCSIIHILSLCQYQLVFITMALLLFLISAGTTYSFDALNFFFQSRLKYLWIFNFPYKISNEFIEFFKISTGISNEIALNLSINLGENWHLYNTKILLIFINWSYSLQICWVLFFISLQIITVLSLSGKTLFLLFLF